MGSAGKILVTGHRGQLGTELKNLLSRTHSVVGIDLPEVDICDRDLVRSAVRQHQPELVIHAAAFTNVDGCESQRAKAFEVNEGGTENVARAAHEVGARVIYYSTDYVFDGEKAAAYVESDQPGPTTVYGQSKLAGEQVVENTLEDFAILRIAWVYGVHGANFVRTMLQLAGQRRAEAAAGGEPEPLKVVSDQYGSPTWTLEIAHQTADLLPHEFRGIYHATAEGETTWYGLARRVFEFMEISIELRPCSTVEFPRPARRPQRSTLENQRLKEAGRNRMRHWETALNEFLELNRKELQI